MVIETNQHHHIADVNKMVSHIKYNPFKCLSLIGDKIVISDSTHKCPLKEMDKKEPK